MFREIYLTWEIPCRTPLCLPVSPYVLTPRQFFGGRQRRLAQLEDGVRETLARIKAAAEIL